jgi:uncharacterized protein YhfF
MGWTTELPILEVTGGRGRPPPVMRVREEKMRSTSSQRTRTLLPLIVIVFACLTASLAAASSYTITPGGAPVTAQTDEPGEKATLKFDGVADQRVSVKLTAVTFGNSGCCSARLSILKPDGTTLKAAAFFGENGAFFDPRTLPVDGQYKIVLDPEGDAKGKATVTLYDVPDNPTVPIVPGGGPQSATMTTPGQNAIFPFHGTAGQRVSLQVDQTVPSARVSIVGPGGVKVLLPATVSDDADTFLGPWELPEEGSYQVVFDPNGAATGGATVELFDVPADVTGTLTAGTPQVVTIAEPGQNARLSLSGDEGQRISVSLTDVSVGSSPCCGAKVSVKKPDGTTLIAATSVGTTGGFLDRTTLPVAGTYKIVVNPVGDATGDITLTLHNVPADDTGGLAFGTPHTFTITTPGQNSVHTFSGQAGKRISLDVSGVTISLSEVSVIKPDGSKLIFPTSVTTSGAFFDTKTLPATGTYKVLLNPTGAATGDATLTVYNVPADVSGDLVVGDPAETFTLSTPGRDAALTFSGSSGQNVTLDLTSVTIGSSGCCSAKVSVLKPDGTRLLNPLFFGTSGLSRNLTLDGAGTYTVVIDPQSNATGNVTAGLSLTPAP